MFVFETLGAFNSFVNSGWEVGADAMAAAKLYLKDIEKILAATLTGMSVDEFNAEVKKWLETAKDQRWKRPYTELTYLPMQEMLKCLRANGYKTYIVTGGGRTSCACNPSSVRHSAGADGRHRRRH